MFLRSGCVLPDGLNPSKQTLDSDWFVVEDLPALDFDRMIRRAGWHFMWLQGACCRRGYGLSVQTAVRRGLLRALNCVPKAFNAAELDSVEITEYPGFQTAVVIVQPLHIQEHAQLRANSQKQPQLSQENKRDRLASTT